MVSTYSTEGGLHMLVILRFVRLHGIREPPGFHFPGVFDCLPVSSPLTQASYVSLGLIMTQHVCAPRIREERPKSSKESPNMHPREMDTNWRIFQRNSVSTLSSSTMENDDLSTSFYYDSVAQYTEPEQVVSRVTTYLII